MDQSQALVIIAGHPPVKANKLRYYAEEVFLERSKDTTARHSFHRQNRHAG